VELRGAKIDEDRKEGEFVQWCHEGDLVKQKPSGLARTRPLQLPRVRTTDSP